MHLDASVSGGTNQAYYVELSIRITNPLPQPISVDSVTDALFLAIIEDEDGDELERISFPDNTTSMTIDPNDSFTYTHTLSQLGGGNTYTVTVYCLGLARPMGSEQRELASTTVTA